MKYLVTGSSGLIGSQLVFDLEQSGEIVYSCYQNTKPLHGIPVKLDLLNLENISKIFQKLQPDIVVHLAALTDVEQCESKSKLAYLINSKATEQIAKECEQIKCFLVYVSTDYVFDGKKGFYDETDSPNPINQYGKTKLDGEKAVQNISTSWSILRTSTPFGNHLTKKTFPVWVVENIKNNNKLNIIEDQFTSPTFVPNLSQMILEVIKRRLEGIIHLSGSTRISRYDFAKIIVNKLNLNPLLLKSVKMNSIPWKSKRPFDSSFNISKAKLTLTLKPFSIEQSLQNYIPLLKESFSL